MSTPTPILVNPSTWEPATFDDLIGPARELGRIFEAKIARYKTAGTGTLKAMLYGQPGVGKTELTKLIAKKLAEDDLAICEASGLQVNIDLVKHWISGNAVGGLFGDWQVKLVQEMDRIPTAAQDLLLQYLDILNSKTAFIGTSNLQLDLLQERFQTRLQTWKVEAPSTEDIIGLVMRWPIPRQVAAQIAVGCGGNVRAALLDTESALDVQLAA